MFEGRNEFKNEEQMKARKTIKSTEKSQRNKNYMKWNKC